MFTIRDRTILFCTTSVLLLQRRKDIYEIRIEMR